MLLKPVVFVILVVLFGLNTTSSAERFIQLKIGPTWPEALKWSKIRTAGDGSIHAGLVVDRKIAFGGGLNFLWNVSTDATPIEGSPNSSEIKESEKTFMFPVSGYLALSPIPQYRIHPCLSTQIGLNTMYYSNKKDTLQDNSSYKGPDENGLYMGFYWKIALDAEFNLGETSGLFAGMEYQISRPQKITNKDKGIITQREMNGFGFRFGVRLIY